MIMEISDFGEREDELRLESWNLPVEGISL
jgi:hypothetical protein